MRQKPREGMDANMRPFFLFCYLQPGQEGADTAKADCLHNVSALCSDNLYVGGFTHLITFLGLGARVNAAAVPPLRPPTLRSKMCGGVIKPPNKGRANSNTSKGAYENEEDY